MFDPMISIIISKNRKTLLLSFWNDNELITLSLIKSKRGYVFQTKDYELNITKSEYNRLVNLVYLFYLKHVED